MGNAGKCPVCGKVYATASERRIHKITSGHGG